MYDRECLYDVDWQCIRVNNLGSWDTVAHVTENIANLREYCRFAANQVNGDHYERVVRCTNYYAAILLGYGSKTMFDEQRKLVKAAHTEFMATMPRWQRKDWDWSKVEKDLRSVTVVQLLAIWKNLQRRIYTSTKRTGGTQHRPELMKFVGLLRTELATRGISK